MAHLTRRSALLAAGALALATGGLTTGARAASGPALKVGIIGAGHVGTTLGQLWAKAGLQVMLSAKSVEDAQSAAATVGGNAQSGTPQQAAAFADVVVLAVPYGAIPAVAGSIGKQVAGKTILDATNPYGFRDGALAAVAARDGAGITTQRYFPGSHVVRGFNSIDMSTIASEAGRAAPLMAVPLAGDDEASLQRAETLVRAAGFEPVLVGDLRAAMLFQPGNPGFEVEDNATDLRRLLHVGG